MNKIYSGFHAHNKVVIRFDVRFHRKNFDSLSSSSLGNNFFFKRITALIRRFWIWSQEASAINTVMFKVNRLLDLSQVEFEYTMIPFKDHHIIPRLFNKIYKLQQKYKNIWMKHLSQNT